VHQHIRPADGCINKEGVLCTKRIVINAPLHGRDCWIVLSAFPNSQRLILGNIYKRLPQWTYTKKNKNINQWKWLHRYSISKQVPSSSRSGLKAIRIHCKSSGCFNSGIPVDNIYRGQSDIRSTRKLTQNKITYQSKQIQQQTAMSPHYKICLTTQINK